jgi:formate hydrogenlyase subunit 3/multisubunit Na+/H+ antiporter MnhD subunit
MILPVLLAIAALLLLAIACVPLARRPGASRIVYGGCLAICLCALVGALLGGATSEAILPLGIPWLGAHFRLDALSRFFLVLVNVGSAFASLYALGYGQHEHEPQRVLPFYPVFLAGMNLVVIAGDPYSFLFAWELMSLASWALVMSHHREAGNARAGFVYLLMATFGALSLLLAFGLLAGPDGGYAFAVMRLGASSHYRAVLVLALVLLGAGSKAGVVPLHVWLPLAHPAAPSHVSALMSGVMTKVAIYAFIRIVFDLLGPPDWWWSVPVLGIGGLTAVLGVLSALMERDLKRLLAYSTIENVGIIFLALGLALAFRANGMPEAAALAMIAGLFHAFNHMLFKSLLFFGAGSVLTATGERNIERLGGLIHRMPKTAGAFLIGCMAISALPPLNGFASEWLTFQTILVSPQLPEWTLRMLVPTVGAALALSAALSAACFVRAFGISFLGRPRSAQAESAVETDGCSLAAMGGLSALCLLTGMFPGAVIDALAPVTELLLRGRLAEQLGKPWLSVVPMAARNSSYNGLMVLLFLLVSAGLAAFAVHRFGSRAWRRGPAWDCGYPGLGPATQYSGASFSQPIRRVFGPTFFGSRESIEMPPPGDMRPARIRKMRHDLVWETIYLPIAVAIGAIADKLNALQFMTIGRYLGFVFLLLVLLLMALAAWQ